MTRLLMPVARLLTTFEKINDLNLEHGLKKKIKNTYLRVLFQKLLDTGSGTIDVVGYKFKYCRRETLACLFSEIFVNQDYFFTTDNRSPFIIDCGSNIGMSVSYFKTMYPESEIIAFEPDDDAYLCLKSNVETNNLKNVEVHKKAVSRAPGQIEFFYDEQNPGSLVMSSVRDRLPKQKRVVDAVRLSDYINKEVDFLKMDIEGAEVDVIEELIDSGKLKYIKQMAIEYHHHIVTETDDFSKILCHLESAGFGYQISSELGRPLKGREFQDVLIYAYRKSL